MGCCECSGGAATAGGERECVCSGGAVTVGGERVRWRRWWCARVCVCVGRGVRVGRGRTVGTVRN